MTKKVFHCNVELTLDIIGGKWKPLIMHHIGNYDSIRYGELKRKIPNINERVLTRQLKDLEKDKLINRKAYNQLPLKVEYSLSALGKNIEPILEQLGAWGLEYNNNFHYGEIDFEDNYQEGK